MTITSRNDARFWWRVSCLTALYVFVAAPLWAQTVRLSGYVKAEAAYDTRQVSQVREGHFHLYPLPEGPETATDNLLLNAFESRLTVTGSGTKALGAALTGVLEADFFGVNNDNVNGLRLRHAYVKLDWGRHEVLAGQYWSPLFSPVVLARVQASNAGAPFQPFARFTQVRYTWKPGAFHVITALSQQRDAYSDVGGTKQQQQAGVPGAHLHGEYTPRDGYLAGAGAYAKALRPQTTGERFNAWAVQGYGLATAGPLTARAKLTYGNDLTDHLMTGGYVQTLAGAYEALRVASAWVDLEAARKAVSLGLFAGYTQNLGAGCDLTGDETALKADVASTVQLGNVLLLDEHTRAVDIDRIWRLAPRLVFAPGALRLSAEVEMTSALYVSSMSDSLQPQRAEEDAPVLNVRTLLSIYYFF
jgi:hypothetical protein